MAEGYLRRMLGPDTSIESAGIETGEGLPPTNEAVLTMRELGLEISDHRSREIASLTLQNFDLVIAMTPQVGNELRSRGVDLSRLVVLNVPDPYGQGMDAYRIAAAQIRTQLGCIFGIEDNSWLQGGQTCGR